MPRCMADQPVSYTHIDMTLHAGVGVVMANGSEKTKSVADHITKDNDHDGIGVFLQEHLISRS